MDKKQLSNIIAIIVGIVVVVLISFFIFNSLNNTSEKSNLENSENIQETEKTTYEGAILDGNLESCEELENQAQRESCIIKLNECLTDECFYEKATHTRNHNLCYNIEDRDLRASCSSSIQVSSILRNSVVNNDISLCNEFEDEAFIAYCKDNFYLAKTKNSGDTSFCQEINREDMKNECLA